MSVKSKTSFGWKRKAGENVNKKTDSFSKDNDDSSDENNGLDDWMSLLPKKPTLLLEDPIVKSVRLKNEGIILAESERFWEAISKWNEAILLNPKDEKLLEMKTQALMSVGEVDPAVETAKSTVILAPTWWVGHQTLGRALANVGDIRMALKSFSRAVHLNPSDTELWREDLLWAKSLVVKLVSRERGERIQHSTNETETETEDSDSDESEGSGSDT